MPLVVAGGIAALALLPGLWVGPSLDAAVFDVVGWRLSEGARLYVDAWDHKPPGTFTVAWVANSVSGSFAAAWAVTWATTVGAVAGTALMLRALLLGHGATPAAALIAAALAAYGQAAYLIGLGGGLSEVPATLLVSIGAVLVLRDGATWRAAMASGALLAAGVVTSVQVTPALVALLAIVIFRHGRLAAFALVGGGVAGLLVLGLALAGAGSLGGALDAVIDYAAAYRRAVDAGPPFRLAPWLVLVMLPLLAPAALAVIGWRRWRRPHWLAWLAMGWTLLGVVFILAQGRLYGHYLIPLAVPLAMLAAIGVDRGLRDLGPRLAVGAAAPVVGLALVVGAAGARMEQAWIEDSNRRSAEVAAAVAGRTGADEAILVWGNEPAVYTRAERVPAIAYPYLYPLLTPGYVTDDLVARLVATLERRPPALVVDAGSPGPGEPGLPPLLIDRPVVTDGRDADLLDPMRDWIRERYRPIQTVEGWTLYEPVEAAP